MRYGRVYLWIHSPHNYLGGIIKPEIVALPRLDECQDGSIGLRGRFVCVKNGGLVNVPDAVTGGVKQIPIGDAEPDKDGNFIFEPGHGGGRMDKVLLADPDFRWRYIQASHFGEVNSYYHVDLIAAYVDELLSELGSPSLPKVTVVVNAHHAATENDGLRDGVMRPSGWLPFQGGHYRLPSAHYNLMEYNAISPDGEIHIGPGWRLLEYGKLVEAAGGRYRANASHNASILYHEYGHHITRHTADFRANDLCHTHQQDNRKIAIDEGMADYWTATLLNNPHIWILHHRHDEEIIHPRSLLSTKTIVHYDNSKRADPHGNGTIWAATLWDLRTKMFKMAVDGVRRTDLMILKSLLLLGQVTGKVQPPNIKSIRCSRKSFAVGLKALLEADDILFSGLYHDVILSTFSARGIQTHKSGETDENIEVSPKDIDHKDVSVDTQQFDIPTPLQKHVSPKDIANPGDVFSKVELENYMDKLVKAPLNILVVGDIMLGDRAKKVILENGEHYPFDAVSPIMKRSDIIVGNLEGPLARKAKKQDRNFSYKVNPDSAYSLAQAGIHVLTLANNHLVDCGREGVLETLDALRKAGIEPVGAGINEEFAHLPVIRHSGNLRIGILGYYWNRRCSATKDLPGSAMDSSEEMLTDIGKLRDQVDHVIVTFHWGIPYEREPLPADREKAHLAIDYGADAVVGHHPHVIQPFEVYRNCPIFYSVGNFTFGSGNSRGEGIMVGLRFWENKTDVEIYPLYVKNRDPRVNYQPKALHGNSAHRILNKLHESSGSSASLLKIEDGHGWLELSKHTSAK